MYGDLKFPNSAGTDYNSLNFEISADVVTYSDTTVAAALDNLSIGKIPHADSVETAEKAEKDLSGNVISETYLTSANAEMTGTPTAPEYLGTDTSVNQIATCGYFNGLVRKYAGEIDSDMTLAKIIASINKDPNFATNVAAQLDNKQDKNSNLTALNNLGSETGLILATSSETLTTFATTDKGKKVLAASDIEKFRGIIQAQQAEFIWDETENVHWQKVGSPTISTANAKFGNALQVSSGNYIKATIPLGGQDFTIVYWSFLARPLDVEVTLVNVVGTTSFGEGVYNDGAGRYRKPYCGPDFAGQTIRNWTQDKMFNIEFAYKHSEGKLYVFKDGGLAYTFTVTLPRENRTIYLGYTATGTIDDFRVLDGVCSHTSNFSPPSIPYKHIDKTVSLVHF